MLLDFEKENIRKYSEKAEYGLERESLRTDSSGKISMTKHPFVGDKHIDRDFCENQTEIITDVFTDADDLIFQLNRIQDKIDGVLAQKNEVLWSFSNPPFFGNEEDIPAAVFDAELHQKNEYRAYLAKKYGKKKMLFSGIHFNFSFLPKLMDAAFSESTAKDFTMFKNELYLKLSKRLTEYAWLVVLLTAASPVTDSSFGIPSNQYASVRCGKEGYWNSFVPILDYSSFEGYIESIESLIAQEKIASVSELYYPVRLKPRGDNSLSGLKANGVNHIELRVMDVNPLSRVGILKEDIQFIHFLMLYLASLPEFEFDEKHQYMAIEKIKQAALYDDEALRQEASRILDKMADFANRYFPQYSQVITFQKYKLRKGCRYAEIVSSYFTDDYISRGLLLAEAYQRRETPCASCSVFLPQKNTLPTIT